eukprot:TRINITY_DN731_c0_g1_i1.p1 TRINITY_DN731_c0_g1~~TRINITY_DN731_c0_g1_i1.p1  ORF type:complete len:985 (-),score=325.54 TRINITY_DN731_c0_g1_i1:253-3099(-)
MAETQDTVRALVLDYLSFHDYSDSYARFRVESLTHLPQPITARTDEGKQEEEEAIKNDLMEAFDKGDQSLFFTIWEESIPVKTRMESSESQKLLFYSEIYFAIYPFLIGNETLDLDDVPARFRHFKGFLESHGSALIQTPEFLPYYALPWVADPREHPSFTGLFKQEWRESLRSRVQEFVGTAVQVNREMSDLEALVKKADEWLSSENGGDGERKGRLMSMDRVRERENNLRREFAVQMEKTRRKYDQLFALMSTSISALESAANGRRISGDFVRTLHRKVRSLEPRFSMPEPRIDESSTRPHQQQSQGGGHGVGVSGSGSFGSSSDASVESSDYSGASGNDAVRDSRTSTKPTADPATLLRETSASSILAPLDYEKIKGALRSGGQSDASDASVNDALYLLQALRWRLTRSRPASRRKGVITAYIQHDILGFREYADGKTTMKLFSRLLHSSDDRIVFETIRLMNAIGNTAQGRSYLLKEDMTWVEHIGNLMKKSEDEPGKVPLRTTSLMILQKASMRLPVRRLLISKDVLEWLQEVLSDADGLSEDTLEYGAALLMNLCLTKEGKVKCKEKIETVDVVSTIMDMMDIPEEHIQQYLNGALYSLLSIPLIRDHAKSIGLEDMIKMEMDKRDESLQRQLQFVLDQLQSDAEEPPLDDDADEEEEDEEEDEDEDEDDEDEDEDEDDEDDDDDVEEILIPNDEIKQGEELLCSMFLAREGDAREQAHQIRQSQTGSVGRKSESGSRKPPSESGDVIRRPSTPRGGDHGGSGSKDSQEMHREHIAASGRSIQSHSSPPRAKGDADDDIDDRDAGGDAYDEDFESGKASRSSTEMKRDESRGASGFREGEKEGEGEGEGDEIDEHPSAGDAPPPSASTKGTRRASKPPVPPSRRASEQKRKARLPPPSEKVVKKLKEAGGEETEPIKEYQFAFSTRSRLPRTPSSSTSHTGL